jgi:hypothetical protein
MVTALLAGVEAAMASISAIWWPRRRGS